MGTGDDIRDDEIRVIGEGNSNAGKAARGKKTVIVAAIIAVMAAICVWAFMRNGHDGAAVDAPEEVLNDTAENTPAYTEVRDTAVAGIPLKMFIPHGAKPEVAVGNIDKADSSIVLGAMAADIGLDNGRWIVAGGFISKGRLVSHSKSKTGFCAIIGGAMTIGNAVNTEIFEKCIEAGGDFFRQYALVDSGKPVSRDIQGKARRRALCSFGGTVAIVETETSETLDDFANVLASIGANEGITLVGSGSAPRWAVDNAGRRYEIGDMESRQPDVANYIVWRKK